VQLVGAINMFHGAISEMQTGEGKTLTATMPLYLHALTKKSAHLVTVNDYLAQRDCEWMGTVFTFLGLSVGALTNNTTPEERTEIYNKDIIYGTASEFGFDYLRDHSMALTKQQQAQRGHFFAIIDEVDSILIDEARTPLIISGPSEQSYQMYDELKQGISILVQKQTELCNKLAKEAQKELQSLHLLQDSVDKLNKQQNKRKEEALKQLWIVTKGIPNHKIVKQIKEHPDMRASLENIDTQFYADQNKEEKEELLAKLFLIVDERASDYELTDLGIEGWKNAASTFSDDDFTILDLGEEYARIDAQDISQEQNLEQKQKIRDEDAQIKERYHNIKQLLRAHLLMEKDIDYIVQEEKIVIIDENTGRPQPGRRFSDGLHQAIEAKESVAIQAETQTYATITLQNYFRLYKKLAGMSGTAMTEAKEFKEIYQLDTLSIPTYKPSTRIDEEDEVYMTEREKFSAILRKVKEVHGDNRPILLGTESVEVSEKLAKLFQKNNLNHTILNARHHEQEAQIIANAGKKGAITIATNMAGRGTDIKLADDVANQGGLAVIGTTRHHSRRIDRQLRGRCGRLGDPGSSIFFASFEDSLIRMFTSPKMTALLQRFRPPEGEAISSPILTRSIETAQKRIEQRNFSIRKHTLEYDDVMNKQRKEVYAFRQEILETEDLFAAVFDLFQQFSVTLVDKFCVGEDPDLWQADAMTHELMSCLPITFTQEELDPYQHSVKELHTLIFKKIKETFQKKMTYEQQKLSEHHDLIQKLADRELIDRDSNRSRDAALLLLGIGIFFLC